MLKGKIVTLLLLAMCVGVWAGASAAEMESKDYYSAVAVGDWHSLALDEQGRLYTWGSNCYGQLGNGKRTNMNNKNLKIIKNADVYTPTRLQLQPEKRFVHVAAGAMHSLALTDSGVLYAWGSNDYGQLGIGSQEIQTKPVPVMADVRWASAFNNSTVAIKTDGTLWVWGEQDKEMYAGAGNQRNSRPRQVASGVIMAAAHSEHILYIDEAGQLWGIGRRYRLGIGDQNQSTFETEPVRILPDVVDIALGWGYSYAVDANGDLFHWGSTRTHGYAEPGDGDSFLTPARLMGDVTRVLSPNLILKRDGSLWEYGTTSITWNRYYSIGGMIGGTSIYENGRQPDEMVKLMNRAGSAAGGQHFLAVDENGALYGWGCNVFGQAGTDKRTKIVSREDKKAEYKGVYIFEALNILDAEMPVRLPTLMDVKKSTKVTIKDNLPKPIVIEPGWEPVVAKLNQRMVARSGPGMKFSEPHGLISQDMEIVAYVQERDENSTWVMVEYKRKDGLLVRTYTNANRVDTDYAAIPRVTQRPQSAKVTKESTVYFGPGKAYKDVKQKVKRGASVLVCGTDMGYALIEYPSGDWWVRSWIALDSIEYQ